MTLIKNYNTKYSVHKFDGFVQKLVTSKNFNEIKKVLDPQNQLDGFGVQQLYLLH